MTTSIIPTFINLTPLTHLDLLRTNTKILHSLQNNNSNLLLFLEALHIKFQKTRTEQWSQGIERTDCLSVIQLSVNIAPHISLFLYSWLCLFPLPPYKDLSTLVNSLVWQWPWNRVEIIICVTIICVLFYLITYILSLQDGIIIRSMLFLILAIAILAIFTPFWNSSA